MNLSSYQSRRQAESQSRDQIIANQLQRLNALLKQILPINHFYQQKLGNSLQLGSLDQLADLPVTTKNELIDSDSNVQIATNLTFPLENYVRFHRTSGTQGRPLVVLDTAEDWQWWIESWQYVLDAAEIEASDRVIMAFSFGPFVGFWSANDAAIARGCLVAPTGGMSSVARLDLIRSLNATALFCTPSYAIHLSQVAEQNNIQTADLSIRKIIVAGEPGGSIPSLRSQIEKSWSAKVIDHAGSSEVGAWGFADHEQTGLFVNENEFIAEFIDPDSGANTGDGEIGELVLTALGRSGSPVIRYRTGDLVKPAFVNDLDCNYVLLKGGVLGRRDDMMIIRGVNIFPSSIDQILRSFPDVVEYRMTATKRGAMDHLVIEVEDRLNQPERLAEELKIRLGLNIEVTNVENNSLPRFEAKGKRFLDERK